MKKYLFLFVCCLTTIFFAATLLAQGFTGPVAPIPQVQITSERARQIALNRTSGGTVIEMEWELKRGSGQYEVEIINSDMKYEIKIDSTTGEIFEYTEKRTIVRELPPSSPQNHITFERVRELAITGRTNAIIEKINWEYKYGQYIYEVSVRQDGKKNKIYMDAITGRTLQPARRGWI